MQDLANTEEAANLEAESSACEMDVDASTQSEIESTSKDQDNIQDNLVDTESTSAQAAKASETDLCDIESAVDSERASKGEAVEECKKTEPAESSEVKESSVEGDDQKKRFVVFCLLEQWLSVSLAPLLTSMGALGRYNRLRISSTILSFFLFYLQKSNVPEIWFASPRYV